MPQESSMDTTPDEDRLWEEIGGHFDNFTQVINEFLDNSKSNFQGNDVPSTQVRIHIEKQDENHVGVQIEDQGTGIEDVESALQLGDKSQTDTALNEHGFGMKHALASGNPDNDDWAVYTRNEQEIDDSEYRKVAAPYLFDKTLQVIDEANEPWPGGYNQSGTLIEFTTSRSFFDTVNKGVRGSAEKLNTAMEYLAEDLGYVYANNIQDGEISINLSCSEGYSETVEAVTPTLVGHYDPGQDTVEKDLGDGKVEIEYEFGELDEMKYKKYYKRTVSQNGIQVRINGRLLEDGLFSEIWDNGEHPRFNRLIGIINLISDDESKLPDTKTAKNGIRSGDPKLNELFQWIRNTMPDPPKEKTDRINERELMDDLKEAKETHIAATSKKVEREFDVFNQIGSDIPADLYVFDGTDTVLYEGKKNTAKIDSVYQLKMYWDGAVKDQLDPDRGIIVASDFSDPTEQMVQEINNMTDEDGNNYNIKMKTWDEEGIDF